MEFHAKSTGPTPRKKGFGARAVADKYNQQLNSPGDIKIEKLTLSKAIARGEVGVSLK